MNRTTVTCTETEATVGADILKKSDRHLRVVLDEVDITIDLHKDSPYKRFYVGNKAGREFTSTGE